MDRGKYLAKNTLIFALGNLGSKLIAFLLVPLYTGILATEEFGQVDLIATVCMVAAPAIFLNVGEAVMRFCLDKDADTDGIMSVAYLVILLAVVPGAAFTVGILLYEKLSEYWLMILLYTVALGISQIALCYLRGKELLFKYSVGNILQTLFIAALNILFLLVFKWGVFGYLLSYVIAYAATAVYALAAGKAFDVFKHFHIKKDLLKKMLVYSVVLIPNTFMWWIMNSSDRLMVTEMRGLGENGIYAAAYKLPTILSVVTGIFNQAYSYSAIKEDSSKDKNEYNESVFNSLLAFLVLIGMGLNLFLKPILSIYVAPEYFTSWFFSPPLIVGMALMALGTFLANFYVVNKDSKGFMFSATAGAVLNVILNFISIPRIGAIGAAAATCFSYFIVFLYRYFDTKKYIKIHVFSLRNILALSCLLASAVLVYFDGILAIAGQLVLIALVTVIKFEPIKTTLINMKALVSKKAKGKK